MEIRTDSSSECFGFFSFQDSKKVPNGEERSACERKCRLSEGSRVSGSVLAAETCPLVEPATAAAAAFVDLIRLKYLFFLRACGREDWREKEDPPRGGGEGEASGLFCCVFLDNDGIGQQKISVFGRDVKASPNRTAQCQ